MATNYDPMTGFKVTYGSVSIYGLARKASDLAAATTYNSTEIVGFYVDAAGSSAWTAVFIDGGSVNFTPTTGEHYPWHLASITSGTGGTGVLFLV